LDGLDRHCVPSAARRAASAIFHYAIRQPSRLVASMAAAGGDGLQDAGEDRGLPIADFGIVAATDETQ
jgi:hypothetical protein